ncbi:hypothetical protein METHPM2_60111 [Pseudomonas sp. PM2]
MVIGNFDFEDEMEKMNDMMKMK